MNNPIPSLRRYAIKKPIPKLPVNAGSLERPTPIKKLNKPIPSHVATPVHKLVHKAMLDAAHEAGLIPGDQPGEQQYQSFAKYRDLAHQELQNPDSPFTKLFNRHKNEIASVPNPQEHLKNALTPMFHYLAKHGEDAHLPLAEPLHDEGQSEPADLLHSGYTPFDEDGGGFGYSPRLPSGFVQVPTPQPKRKPSPQRHDVYKSIAEHADMGWSAPSNLKDYLVQKHGITPQEAVTHINNFKRRQNKPAAPAPTPTNRVWPPVQRKARKYDPTDLMAIPRRYMRVSDPQTHDALMKGIVKNNDESGLGPFADFLDEQGAPGAALAREAHKNSLDSERITPPFDVHNWWNGNDDRLQSSNFITEDGGDSTHSSVPNGEVNICPEISRPYDVGNYRTGALIVTHGPQTNDYTKTRPSVLLSYHVPVESKKHLKELTHDLPEPMRNRLWSVMARHLRDTHEPEQMSRKRYAKPGSTGPSVQVTAKGEPYIATKNGMGYGIVPAGNSINRISRSYQVYCNQDGTPVSCSCPDHVYRHRVCKHMEAVAGIAKGGGEPEAKDDDAVKMSAFKAPAKGVIIRGSQYSGGSFVPDLTDKFSNPRRRMFNRCRGMLK